MKTGSLSIKQMSQCLLALVPCLVLSLALANQGTVYFSDDFEHGLVNWDIGGDSFQITDLFYRSAGHCASDSPNGNYPANANSIMRMKLAKRIDFSKSTDPVLRFWHRIGVYSGDYGYVEISEDLGFTWKLLRSYTNTWRSTWSFEQIDLSAYKASPNPVLIRFRLRDDGGTDKWGNPTVTWGWDIDDIEIMERDTDTIPFPFFDDFESGLDHWMLRKGDAWQLTDKFYRDPNHCVSESPNGNYPANACSDLILVHPIDLSSSSFPVLTFWHRIGIYGGDHGYIEISQDGGTSWVAKPLADYTNLWLANWTFEQIDLSAYKTSANPILIRFRLRDDGGTDKWGNYTVTWGWDIDDVAIQELIYPVDPLIVQITEVDNSSCPVVRATITVADVNGAPVVGLKASNFSVYEDPNADSRPRTLISVEPNIPMVHASQALDYSASMGAKAIADAEGAAKAFVNLMNANDCGEIIKFANGVEVMHGYTNDKALLRASIDHTTKCDSSQTWLYDAIYQAISDAAGQPRKRAVIVMTDGKDTKSPPGRSATEIINYAKTKGVPVFTIGLGAEVDEQVLIMIAQQTGGLYYPAGASSDLMAIYQKIAGTIKNQYIVTYESAVCKPSGTGNQEHEVQILVENGDAYGLGTKRFTCPPVCNPK